jgi:small GTP-binding protein
MEGHADGVNRGVFSTNGQWFVSTSFDDTFRLWRCDTWACVAAQKKSGPTHPKPPALAFCPGAPKFATIDNKNHNICVWRFDEAVLLGQTQSDVNYTTAKLVLVGDAGVGKTGLGWRLAHGEFKEHSSTHGQQFWTIPQLSSKRADGTECEAVLWDLAGQHVYRQVHAIFLENVAAAIVLFDPGNRLDPLKGVQFWLQQLKGRGELPPTVLVGARVDRGAPGVSKLELDQFCQRHGISSGYLGTSALSGEGLPALLDKLKGMIPWEKMTATVTTATFKRIKEYVLSLKEKTDRKDVLVTPEVLRKLLRAEGLTYKEEGETKGAGAQSTLTYGAPLQFTDLDMMTAVGHLETHGFVSVLHDSAGERFILLTPDLLVSLSASIVLLADKNPRELGAVSESDLLQQRYPFAELEGLAQHEQQILIDAAIQRFLEHSLCYRETMNSDTLLIFPSLIRQKRPLQDDLATIDDISYVVRGPVENLYPSMVVLLGYTPSFNRINQWQNQAQYEMEDGGVCGFRTVDEREGELELVLYYAVHVSAEGRSKFQESIEQFLYQRNVEVVRIPPVNCPNGHRLERATVLKRTREDKQFVFCDECGSKTALPSLGQAETVGINASPWLQREEALARLRNSYEVELTQVKSYRRAWAIPRCYLSHTPDLAAWAERLCHDLRDAGVFVVDKAQDVLDGDCVIVLDTSAYQQAFTDSSMSADARLVRARLGNGRALISLRLHGPADVHEFDTCAVGTFCDETHYAVGLLDLVLNLYAIPLAHAGFSASRRRLHALWSRAAVRLAASSVSPVHLFKSADKLKYIDFEVLVTTERTIRASSEQGELRDEFRLDMSEVGLSLKLIERDQTDADLLKRLGGVLFQALFPNKVHGHLRATQASAEASGSSVRLRLVLEPPDLAALPWEFLYDESTGVFVANNTQTALSRYLNVQQPRRAIGRVGRPLRILLVVSSPKDLDGLDATREEELIRMALTSHVTAGDIELDVVRDATIRNLNQQLRTKLYGVVHFIGHSSFKNERGHVALVDSDGNAKLVDEETFASLFLGNSSIGLVVLNSCRGAATSSVRAMTGVAPTLVRRGISAVIAMQYDILDSTAKQFADEFYRTVALGWPVDAALQTTRNAISMEVGTGSRDFATPVLFMRSLDGVILGKS